MTRDEIMNLYRKHVACELAHDSTGAASTYHVDGTYLHMPTGLFFRAATPSSFNTRPPT